MTAMARRWVAVLIAVGSMVVASCGVEVFVSPTGDDAQAGTAAAPLRTLAGAQRRAREQAGREPVTVLVQAGTYYLDDTLVFGGQDSGTKAAPVVYRAAPGARPVLSGGRRLELAWQPYRDGILKAATPAGEGELDQLFLNGRRLPMARYPNYDAAARPYNGAAADAFSPARAARWKDPAGGFIHAMHRAHWGGYHYRITGKNAKDEVAYEGGWQNNRQMGMHPQDRFVENIFEELDAPGEWFHDRAGATLYLSPPEGVGLATSVVEVVRLAHLAEFRGTREAPVRFVSLEGFVFRHAARTFMQTREPLLRSDWTVYRGGAVSFEHAEECGVGDCEFDQMGGNAVFVNRYNRGIWVRGCHLHDTGASAVAFVGDPGAVRNPLFEYGQRQGYGQIDRTPGPQTDNYPSGCVVEDCLIERAGVVEKQATGVQISMAQGITVRHCSIYGMSRAGINISEGTFGGHLIEFCDVFDTVRETGDHGSFNSWGRDRFWGLKDAPADELPALALLDASTPTIIRNSRWRCDHGWDIDLDDGSSNYWIYNNLLLNGGLKLREGFHRRVWNNITVGNTLHPHVWYDNSQDVVTNNIWMGAYRPAGGMPKGKWGAEIDRNLFTAEADRAKFAAHGCDTHSVVGDPMFVDPSAGDYRVRPESPAAKQGFVNFPMDRFGVRKAELRAIARTPVLPGAMPVPAAAERVGVARPVLPAYWLQSRVRDLEGEEFSAYGVSRESGGVILLAARPRSSAASAGLRAEDLIQRIDDTPVRNVAELLRATDAAGRRGIRVGYVRGQVAAEALVAEHVHAEAWSGGAAEAERRLAQGASEGVLPIQAVATRPETSNEPVAVLHDGRLGANYGAVFGNGTGLGLYKVDLGRRTGVMEVRTWSFNQNGNRGAQHFVLYGSAADADPGWDVADEARFVPLAEVRAACAERYLATSVGTTVDAKTGLGTFRWLVWAVRPVTAIQENTAYQEFVVREGR